MAFLHFGLQAERMRDAWRGGDPSSKASASLASVSSLAAAFHPNNHALMTALAVADHQQNMIMMLNQQQQQQG